MEDKTKLLDSVLSDISLTTIFKVSGFDYFELPDSSKEIHVYGRTICSEEPVEIYHSFTDAELESIRSNYSIGGIIKITGSHNIYTGGLLTVNNPSLIKLSPEVCDALEIFF